MISCRFAEVLIYLITLSYSDIIIKQSKSKTKCYKLTMRGFSLPNRSTTKFSESTGKALPAKAAGDTASRKHRIT